MYERVRRQNLEAGEAIITSISPEWLGGFFEIGGWIGFEVSKTTSKQKRTYEYAYPRASLVDNHKPKLETLANLLGGVVNINRDHNRNEQHIVWTLSNSGLAVCLAEHMRKYSPSHQETILAFQNWRNTTDREERVEIANLFRETEKPVLIAQDYLPLVESSIFLAGVLDNRGFVDYAEHMHGDKSFGNITPQIVLKSTNRPLLEALHEVWGGSLGQTLRKGDILTIHDRVQVIMNDSFIWRAGIQPKSKIVTQLDGRLKLLNLGIK